MFQPIRFWFSRLPYRAKWMVPWLLSERALTTRSETGDKSDMPFCWGSSLNKQWVPDEQVLKFIDNKFIKDVRLTCPNPSKILSPLFLKNNFQCYAILNLRNKIGVHVNKREIAGSFQRNVTTYSCRHFCKFAPLTQKMNNLVGLNTRSINNSKNVW